MFAKITGAGEWAKSLKFQHTSRNTFNIEVDDSLINLHLWTEITPEEFNSEWQKFLSKIKSLS